MGTWNFDSFGNDVACDWAYSMEDTEDMGFVEETLRKVADFGEDYLEAPDAEEAIAAAEVVARLKGRFGVRNSYTETVDRWVKRHRIEPDPFVVELAFKAIGRILTDHSELLMLWKESENFDAWKKSVEDLRARIEEIRNN